MNKAELIAKVAETLGTSKADAGKTVEAVVGAIIEGTVATGECVVPGLGKLKLTDVAASSGVAMGKKWEKPAHKKVKLNLSAEGKTLGN
jgi:nucleoid DNA-binding protein